MLIEFTYKKAIGGGGKYIVLVIDPSRQNERAKEEQLHGFIVDDMSDAELIRFISNFKTSITLMSEDRRMAIVDNLNSTDAYAEFKASEYKDKRIYRTFNVSKITRPQQILVGSPD
jgi:hypothetical protein